MGWDAGFKLIKTKKVVNKIKNKLLSKKAITANFKIIILKDTEYTPSNIKQKD
jgi:hypothetical protein